MNSRGQLQLALVGLGEFGQRYLRALSGMPGASVAWVCDLDAEKCKTVAETYNVPRHTTDFWQACEDTEVDAVLVVTPEAAHRAIAVAALETGKHVLVEKPLATTEEDALEMIAAAERTQKLLMTAFLLRFDYRYAQLHQRLDQIGAIRTLYAYRNFDRSLFQLYCRTHSFIENAIHDIDLILWYVNSSVRCAHGFCRNTQGLENPDVNWGVLEFENGTLAVLQTTWLYPPQSSANLQWNAGIQVMGDRGVLEIRNDSDGFRANIEETGLSTLDQTGWADIHGEPRGAFGAMLRHFLSCLRGEATYQGATPRQALEAMRVARLLAENAADRE